jgi:hypothetical protein
MAGPRRGTTMRLDWGRRRGARRSGLFCYERNPRKRLSTRRERSGLHRSEIGRCGSPLNQRPRSAQPTGIQRLNRQCWLVMRIVGPTSTMRIIQLSPYAYASSWCGNQQVCAYSSLRAGLIRQLWNDSHLVCLHVKNEGFLT